MMPAAFRRVVVTAFLVLSTLGFAERFYYLGTLGDERIQMDLSLEDGSARGSYYYEAVGAPLDLEGHLDEGGQLRLEAYTRPDTTLGRMLTGSFQGRLELGATRYGATFSGDWQSADGEGTSFILEKVADYAEVAFAQGVISARATYPFLLAPLDGVNDGVQTELHTSLLDFVREGQAYLLEDELFNGWQLERASTLRYASADFVSVAEEIYVYTGGAHGNTGLASYNVLLDEGRLRRLELADLFLPGADHLALLSPYVLEALREQGAQWVLDGEVDGLGGEDLSVFTVDPTGLTFAFEPYLMGPYAQGVFYVRVPFEVLAPVTDPAGPLARFLD